jgi:hypothetical protein
MHTFVVRIYRSGEDDAGVRGVVDDVASGLTSTFRTPEELLKILAPLGEPMGRREPSPMTGVGPDCRTRVRPAPWSNEEQR